VPQAKSDCPIKFASVLGPIDEILFFEVVQEQIYSLEAQDLFYPISNFEFKTLRIAKVGPGAILNLRIIPRICKRCDSPVMQAFCNVNDLCLQQHLSSIEHRRNRLLLFPPLFCPNRRLIG